MAQSSPLHALAVRQGRISRGRTLEPTRGIGAQGASVEVGSGVSVEEIRFVINFRTGGTRKGDALTVIKEALTSCSRRLDATLTDALNRSPSENGGDWLSVVELSVRAYTQKSEESSEDTFLGVNGSNVSLADSAARPGTSMILTRRSREVVTECVERGLADALGEYGKDVIIDRLQADYGFSTSEVPDYPGRFSELLDELLQGGGRFSEQRIVKELNDRHLYEGECSSLKGAVRALATVDAEDS
jgi:hypothetical protein